MREDNREKGESKEETELRERERSEERREIGESIREQEIVNERERGEAD